MSRILSAVSSSTTTVTVESSSNENKTEEMELPTLSQLLTSIDVSNVRSEAGRNELRNTIQSLVARAEADGVSPLDYMKLAILIGFKRRNHDKSQAPGIGAGERDCLRVILHEIYNINSDLVKRVLPFVPLYGSWRDMQVLAEMAVPAGGEIAGLSRDIAELFASQLQRDDTVTKSSLNDCPSNACKYAPHEFRHSRSRKNRKAEKKSQARKIQAHLGDIIANKIFSSSSAHVRPQYRKLLSSLNARLTDKGFLIEPLLCRKEKSKIKFNRAAKGSLNKYRKSIMKDPVASRKWRVAMSKSDSAVPDINDLGDVARQIFENEDTELVAMMIGKCVNKLRSIRSELSTKASDLLSKLMVQEDGDESLVEVTRQLQLGSGVAIYPVVDSNGTSPERLISLLLCAYIVARSQQLSHFILDGSLVAVVDESKETVDDEKVDTSLTPDPTSLPSESPSQPTRNAESKEEITLATKFLARIIDLSQATSPLRSRGDLERVSNGISALLDSIHYEPNESTQIRHVDCLFLTVSSLDEIQGDMEQYQATLNTFQHRSQNESNLRTLCIHRLIHTFNAEEGSIPLVMRPTRSITDKSEVTLDLLLIMDLTGSMGSWMEQTKQHLVEIVNSLKTDTGIGDIRVGFVGYRDYGDAGRTVHHPFVPIRQAEQVLNLIRGEHASGGGDFPEDVLGGFTIARSNFHWNSDLRLMLLVADAPAHGYSSSGDYYKSGRCPDQEPPHLDLEETTRALAFESNVDLLFCRLSAGSTDLMEQMFQNVYISSGGFGVLPITSGPEAFRAAILSTISSSILKAIAPDNIGGLQTFSGATASSLFNTVNSSLRESLSSISKTFNETTSTSAMEVIKDDEVGADGIDLGIEGEEEEAEDKGEDDDGRNTEEKGESVDIEPPVSMKRPRPVTTSTRTDYERIMSELNLEELSPIRLALGMPVEESLLDKSAEILFKAGVTVRDLQDQGYPEGIIEVMTNSGLKKLKTI